MLFDWDHGNTTKCQKHGLTLEEIEHALAHEPRVAPDEKHSAQEQRFIAIGTTQSGRLIFVAFCWRGERIRPISARYMHEREIARYEAAQGSGPHH